MAEQQTFSNMNRERIQAVENTFGRRKSLLRPDRILVGEGCLLKLCRHGPKPKVFFLFNDILVYGSIMVPGHWNNKKQIIPLDEVEVEDMQDETIMANQWLIRTPRKSFYVSAASPDEKQAWMEHIEQYKALLIQHKGRPTDSTARRSFAVAWIPDMASAICMRCSVLFTIANRRHHCRMCGYIVCGACSKDRALLLNISSRPVRVCRHCVVYLQGQDDRETRNKQQRRVKIKEWKKRTSVEDTPTLPEYEGSSEEEEDSAYQVPTKRFSGAQQENHSDYCNLRPEHRMRPLMTL